jgi:hypothetical protein
MQVLKYVLTIYAWLVIGMLLIFLGRIAYFYEKTSGQRVGHYLLFIPSLLLAGGAVWYLLRSVEFIGESIGNVLLFIGGLLLFLFSGRLQELMTGERR